MTARALTIAGSDSGGGAGIQADLKTFLALQVHGMSAITAVTVQNSIGVSGIHPVPPQGVAEQIEAVVSDIGVDAIKIGMLGSAEVIGAVAETLRRRDAGPVVVDPVAVSKHGDPLLRDDAVETLRDEILPLATLVTPNLGEAELFTGVHVVDRESQIAAAKELRALGAASALVKGGHLPEEDDAVDVLLGPAGDVTTLRHKRIATEHTHGTGCTLSAAIAAWLARGADLPEAVRRGKDYVTAGIADSYPLGKGIGPVGHFWRIRPTE